MPVSPGFMLERLFSYVLPTGIMRKMTRNNNPAVKKTTIATGKQDVENRIMECQFTRCAPAAPAGLV
jgi:hypothetical protein